MGFTRKAITVRFTLGDASAIGTASQTEVFSASGTNTVELTGYRISAAISKAGGASMGEAHLRIYGMSLSLMNELSTLGRTPVFVGKNLIDILAGDEGAQSLIFRGTMQQAFTDLGGAPEGMFQVSAYSMLYQAVQAIAPTSFKGPTDVALILQGLATQMGMTFENNGVSVILRDPAYNGSAKTQAEAVVHDAGIEWNHGDMGVLAIWPKGGSRQGAIPLISKDTGMVGYPYPSGQGLLGVRTEFNPAINFGGRVQVQSDITPACGTWGVVNVVHEIESEMPGGQWFTSIVGSPPGYVPVYTG